MEALISPIGNILTQFIDGSAKVAALGVSGVLAFFMLVQLGFIMWLLKSQKEGAKLSYDTRIEEAKDGMLMANAVDKLANEIKELRYSMKCTGGK